MPEKSVFTFYHNFYSKPKEKLEDVISDETKEKLQVLKQTCNDIVSQHSSNIGLTYLEEMVIETDPELPPIVTKLYHLPLKHHKFVKQEIESLIYAGLIKRSMNLYATTLIVVPKKV